MISKISHDQRNGPIHSLSLGRMPAPSRVTSHLWRPPLGFRAFANTRFPHSLSTEEALSHVQRQGRVCRWPVLQAPRECGSISLLWGAVCRGGNTSVAAWDRQKSPEGPAGKKLPDSSAQALPGSFCPPDKVLTIVTHHVTFFLAPSQFDLLKHYIGHLCPFLPGHPLSTRTLAQCKLGSPRFGRGPPSQPRARTSGHLGRCRPGLWEQ